MFEFIDRTYRRIFHREAGDLFHKRADFVKVLCIMTSIMLAILFAYEYLFISSARFHPVVLLFLIPYSYFMHRYIGWWAGWIFVTRIIILSIVYRSFIVADGFLQLLSAHILSTMLSGYIYGLRGIFIASVVQSLGLWYWNIYLAGVTLSVYQIIPAFIAATIWVFLFAYSEYTRSSLMHDVQDKATAVNSAYHDTIVSLADALGLRDNDTYEHSERVARLTVEIAARFGFEGEDLENVQRGAILHDLGKLGVPDSILRKPGPLNEEEWAVMRQHPDLAVHIVRNVTFLIPALPILQSHHERWDGSGYPQGLRGEEIPLEARIFAVVDVYDALTSDRPYHEARSSQEAINYLYENAGILFDPSVIPVLEDLVALYEQRVSEEDDDQLQ